MTEKENEDFMHRTYEFMKAVSKHLPQERGVKAYCECPLCGGTVEMFRIEYNGHLRAKCNKCDASLIQ